MLKIVEQQRKSDAVVSLSWSEFRYLKLDNNQY